MTTPARQSITSSSRQAGACDGCGAGLVIQFTQTAVAGNLQWSWGALCPACRKSIGQEGHGATPSEIRAAILGAEGEWRIEFRHPSLVAIVAIKAIRGVTGLGLKEAKDAWDAGAASGAGLRGTRAECEALLARLRDDGIEAEMMFAGAATPPVVPTPAPAGEGDSQVAIPGGASVAISVIKAIREAFGVGLKEAKDLWDGRGAGDTIRGTRAQCEALAARLQAAGTEHQLGVPGGVTASAETSAGTAGWVVRVVDEDHVAILAIKAIRSATALGLKEAKDVWDHREPGGVLRGSRNWCERVEQAMRKEGISATASPA
jgi:ribosomal protein L7/L12